MEPASPRSATTGFMLGPKMEQGHATLTLATADGGPRFPLSSTARDLIVVVGLPCAIHEYVQLVVPFAGCQVVPPSVDTSTPATTPPPASPAVPLMVTAAPSVRLAPEAGELICELGGVVSVDGLAATRPPSRLNGWAPMSAKRLTVACCIVLSGEPPVGLSRPHDHWTVPAPKTRAPEGARYMVRWCVAVELSWVDEP